MPEVFQHEGTCSRESSLCHFLKSKVNWQASGEINSGFWQVVTDELILREVNAVEYKSFNLEEHLGDINYVSNNLTLYETLLS